MVAAYLAGIITVAIVVISAMAIYSYFHLKRISKKLELFYNDFISETRDIKREMRDSDSQIYSYISERMNELEKSKK